MTDIEIIIKVPYIYVCGMCGNKFQEFDDEFGRSICRECEDYYITNPPSWENDKK